VGLEGRYYIYRMGHLSLSTWHIFGVCQVDNQSVVRGSANFSERRACELRLGTGPDGLQRFAMILSQASWVPGLSAGVPSRPSCIDAAM
jgi:hypothetical protein